MLLTPNLDYQLMEHWSPSLEELVRIEAEEEVASAAGAELEVPPGPLQLRRQFSADAEMRMQADVLEKLKELICSHSVELRRFYEQADVSKTGCVTLATWGAGLREVVHGGQALPWEHYAAHLASPHTDNTISYRTFLHRYRVTPGASSGWQSRLLSSIYTKLSKLSLQDTVALFDTNQDGFVSFDELKKVMSTFAMGLPEEAVVSLTRQLLRGQDAMRTSDLLDIIDVACNEATDGPTVRVPPPWAIPLLEAVSNQCSLRQTDPISSFKEFDSDGDGFISVPEFERTMLSLSGHGEPQSSLSSEQQERVVAMLQDLAAWVDRDGDGKINYLEFISAFRVGTKNSTAHANVSAPVPAVTDAINMLLEHLCSFFYRHRWSLRHAFEYFDADKDGVLTPEEFATALSALSSISADDPDQDGLVSKRDALRLTPEQTENLVASLDRNADGVIDYEEFISALQARDAMQM